MAWRSVFCVRLTFLYRVVVARMIAGTKRVPATLSWLYEGWDGPVAYVVHGQNEVDGVTRAETMFAYWIAYHTLPTCRTRIQH